MRQELKGLRSLPWPPRLPPLESNDHHSPALRWSLLLHIMELRKNGLEVEESIYSSFIRSAATEKVSICWGMIPKMVKSNLINAKRM
jgi:hypothetical protein